MDDQKVQKFVYVLIECPFFFYQISQFHSFFQVRSLLDDFKIICTDDDISEFYVTKELLAKQSDVLARAVENDFTETKDAELKIEEFTKETVESFLKYLHIQGKENYFSLPFLRIFLHYQLTIIIWISLFQGPCQEYQSTGAIY